jgi:hypothetical protein
MKSHFALGRLDNVQCAITALRMKDLAGVISKVDARDSNYIKQPGNRNHLVANFWS